jgi:hypothetical protein
LFGHGDVDWFLIVHIRVDVPPGKGADLVKKTLLRLIDAFIAYPHALGPWISSRGSMTEH